jgi:hypothetical protein
VTLQPVSVGLKFGFLAVLYLFLVWVAFSSIRDLRRGRGSGRSYDDGYESPESSGPYDATGMYDAVSSGLREPEDFETASYIPVAS